MNISSVKSPFVPLRLFLITYPHGAHRASILLYATDCVAGAFLHTASSNWRFAFTTGHFTVTFNLWLAGFPLVFFLPVSGGSIWWDYWETSTVVIFVVNLLSSLFILSFALPIWKAIQDTANHHLLWHSCAVLSLKSVRASYNSLTRWIPNFVDNLCGQAAGPACPGCSLSNRVWPRLQHADHQ